MLTRPHIAGSSNRASTTIVATVVVTLRTWATKLHFMPWTVLLVSVSGVNGAPGKIGDGVPRLF